MKAKLIKTSKDSHHNGHYFLNDGDGFAIGSTDKDWCKRAVKKRPLYILSLPNCQAIERGYDLDELAKENAKHYPNNISQEYINSVVSFKDGFQKALEILGDKKFSEENLLKAFTVGLFSEFEKANYTKEYDNFIQSLQQTEWEVEIVTFTEDDLKSVSEDWGKLGKPKLDATGCLTLKRI